MELWTRDLQDNKNIVQSFEKYSS